jgi:hypothetical protein
LLSLHNAHRLQGLSEIVRPFRATARYCSGRCRTLAYRRPRAPLPLVIARDGQSSTLAQQGKTLDRDAIFALSTEADSIEIYALRKAISVPASPSKLDQSLVLGVLAQCWRRLSNGLKALPEFFRRPRLII